MNLGHLIAFTCLLLAAAGCGINKDGGGEVVIEPGKVRVVVAVDACATVRFAAREMSGFLSRVLGCAVPVANEPDDGEGVSVILGDNRWSRAEELDASALARDGFWRLARGRRIYLLGRDDPEADAADMANGRRASILGDESIFFERATAFAVYDFLERFADCRFFFPGELGTVVPRLRRIAVPGGLDKVEPVFTERYYASHRAGRAWRGAEMPMNVIQGLNQLRLRYGTFRTPCCHGQRNFRYVRRFAKDHPDWFCMQKNGKRYLVDTEREPTWKNGKLCYTSPIREEMYKDVRAYLLGHSPQSRGLERWGYNCRGRCVDIMPEDSMMECHCAACQAAYDKGSKMYATELIWGLTAEIAKRLAQEGIKGDVVQMAYTPYRPVPQIDLPTNIQVVVAESGPFRCAIPREMAAEIGEIRAWSKKLGKKVTLWTYPGKYGGRFPDLPQIAPHAYAGFFREAAPWVNGGYAETESDRFIYDVLNVYVYAKLGWDPYLDVDTLIDDFHSHLFGPAAGPMKDVYALLEQMWIEGFTSGKTIETPIGPVTPSPSAGMLWSRIYTPARMERLAKLFDSAAALVKPGTRESRCVAMMRAEMFEPLQVQSVAMDVSAEVARRKKQKPLNLLLNGECESVDNWTCGVDGAKLEVDSSVKATGAASLRLSTPADLDTKRYLCAEMSQRLCLKRGSKYRLSYFIRTEDVAPYNSYEGAGLCLLEGWPRSEYYTKHPQPLLRGSCEWVHLSMVFTARADVATIQFRMAEAAGRMWVDDVLLEEWKE